MPKLRFKGFSGEWEEKKLEKIANITMGQSPNSDNYTQNPNDYILIQGNADLKNHKVVPRIWTTQVTKLACKEDIIMTVRAPVGEVSILNYPQAVIGRGVASLTMKNNIDNFFVYYLLTKLEKEKFWHVYMPALPLKVLIQMI